MWCCVYIYVCVRGSESDLAARGAAVFILQGSAVSLLFFDLVHEHADN